MKDILEKLLESIFGLLGFSCIPIILILSLIIGVLTKRWATTLIDRLANHMINRKPNNDIKDK